MEIISKLSVDDILIDVVETFGKSVLEIQQHDRHEEMVMIRMVYINASNILTDANTHEIARPIKRERSNVSHHTSEIKKWIFTRDDLWLEYWNKYIHNSKLWKEYSNNKS